VLVRAVDRRHSLDLTHAGADFHIRETFESAMVLGAQALKVIGVATDEIASIGADIRNRDTQRFQLESTGGPYAGRALFSGKQTSGSTSTSSEG